MSRRRDLFQSKIKVKTSGVEYSSAVTLSCSSAGSRDTITVMANRNWEKPAGEPNWVKPSINEGGIGPTDLVLTVMTNYTEESRSGEVTLRTKNRRKSAKIFINQEIGHEQTFKISFAKGNSQTDTIHRIDYEVSGVSGYLTDITSQDRTISGDYPDGTVIYYSARTTGYYDYANSGTVNSRDLKIWVTQTKVDTEKFFEILDAFYFLSGETEVTPTESYLMPETDIFNPYSLTPQRAAFVPYSGLKGAFDSDVDMWWVPKSLDLKFRTNVDPSKIYAKDYDVSGSTGDTWVIFWDRAIHGAEYVGDMTYNTKAGIRPIDAHIIRDEEGDEIHCKMVELYYCPDVFNSQHIADLPIVSETSEDPRLFMFSGQTAPYESNVLRYDVDASAGYVDVWATTSKPLIPFRVVDSSEEYEYEPLQIYNADASEIIVDQNDSDYIRYIYPTILSGSNGMMRFQEAEAQDRYHFKIRYPSNPASYSGRSYGIGFRTISSNEDSSVDHVNGYVFIEQDKNLLHYDDFYVKSLSLTYNDTGYGLSAITIPSDGISYYRGQPSEMAISVFPEFCCHKWNDQGTINDSSYTYTQFISSSGGGVAVNTGKIQIEFPVWMSLANGTGGSLYEFSPLENIPWTLNVTQNKGYNTGSTRTGNVTVKWVGGSQKQGAPSAMTVSVTQPFTQLERPNPVYIYSVGGAVQPNETTSVTAYFSSQGESINMLLSGVSGTSVMFGTYMGDSNINNNLTVRIGSKTLEPTSTGITYTLPNTGYIDFIVTDKGNSASYDVTLEMSISGVPAGSEYGNKTLYFRIIKS